jgi:hypothetical protein
VTKIATAHDFQIRYSTDCPFVVQVVADAWARVMPHDVSASISAPS